MSSNIRYEIRELERELEILRASRPKRVTHKIDTPKRKKSVAEFCGYTSWDDMMLKGKKRKEIIIEENKKLKDKSKKKPYDREHLDRFYGYWGDVTMCMQCGDRDRLTVHHKDKNHSNNDYENLIKLCYACHTEAHKGDRVYNLMKKTLVSNKPVWNRCSI